MVSKLVGSHRFRLVANLKKTEVVLQPSSRQIPITPVIKAGETVLKVVDK